MRPLRTFQILLLLYWLCSIFRSHGKSTRQFAKLSALAHVKHTSLDQKSVMVKWHILGEKGVAVFSKWWDGKVTCRSNASEAMSRVLHEFFVGERKIKKYNIWLSLYESYDMIYVKMSLIAPVFRKSCRNFYRNQWEGFFLWWNRRK